MMCQDARLFISRRSWRRYQERKPSHEAKDPIEAVDRPPFPLKAWSLAYIVDHLREKYKPRHKNHRVRRETVSMAFQSFDSDHTSMKDTWTWYWKGCEHG